MADYINEVRNLTRPQGRRSKSMKKTLAIIGVVIGIALVVTTSPIYGFGSGRYQVWYKGDLALTTARSSSLAWGATIPLTKALYPDFPDSTALFKGVDEYGKVWDIDLMGWYQGSEHNIYGKGIYRIAPLVQGVSRLANPDLADSMVYKYVNVCAFSLANSLDTVSNGDIVFWHDTLGAWRRRKRSTIREMLGYSDYSRSRINVKIPVKVYGEINLVKQDSSVVVMQPDTNFWWSVEGGEWTTINGREANIGGHWVQHQGNIWLHRKEKHFYLYPPWPPGRLDYIHVLGCAPDTLIPPHQSLFDRLRCTPWTVLKGAGIIIVTVASYWVLMSLSPDTL
ncbi:hypothetical protein CEE36_08730 [candidate division TA06 bacterium B3_TA06]|uniref:Uncharacterized protein n=1 Tax=candidate division TA06 bacterium B3_TA06 TaxID=2012487 RepID=A0A532V169_UNCT6|nr:MAG: hypothetical protein CEE36_08730 [candidate division TA06 bacterium B3_TA06]